MRRVFTWSKVLGQARASRLRAARRRNEPSNAQNESGSSLQSGGSLRGGRTRDSRAGRRTSPHKRRGLRDVNVRARTEVFPFEQAELAFAKVMENRIRFRAVLTP
jgi:hypothetical protein